MHTLGNIMQKENTKRKKSLTDNTQKQVKLKFQVRNRLNHMITEKRR